MNKKQIVEQLKRISSEINIRIVENVENHEKTAAIEDITKAIDDLKILMYEIRRV